MISPASPSTNRGIDRYIHKTEDFVDLLKKILEGEKIE